jgi:lipopolysaccharide transport system permease protein
LTVDEVVVRIAPTTGWRSLKPRELWAHRDLVYFFAWRDVKVRYKQTALGLLWAVLQPLITLLLFGVVFHQVASIPSDGVPYAAFTIAGLVPWTFVSNGFNLAANSLVLNANLLGTIYFPRLILPLGSVISSLVDLAISTVLAVVLLLLSGVGISSHVVVFPVLVVLAAVATLGMGLWLGALNVYYRDVRHAVPFLTQMLLFATPIAYPASLAHGYLRVGLALNPITAVVEGFRWALLGSTSLPFSLFACSVASAVVTFLTGAAYFLRMERAFADVV